MTKKLLEKILSLFAITAYSGITQEQRKNFEIFIYSNVSEEFRTSYFDLFNKLLEKHESASSDKKLTMNSVKYIKYCKELFEKTELKERYVIFASLLNFIGSSKELHEQQKEFLKLIPELFEINNEDFENILAFKHGYYEKPDSSKTKKVYEDKVLKFNILKTQTPLIFFKTFSKGIIFDSQKCDLNHIYIANYTSLIKTSYLKKYNYKDLISLLSTNDKKSKTELHVNNLSVKLKNNLILDKASFSTESGELVGIMGKSGSGKSTLLRALAGVNETFDGSYFYLDSNGNQKTVSDSFVAQDNFFIPGFTVEDHLIDRLRYLQIPEKDHADKISEVLNNVELTEHKNKIALKSDNINSELSGGQQKRLSIAMSLLQNPDVIIMDEPSSGLSAVEATRFFNLLKSLSLQNKIVICSVHQPDIEIFSMFDKIMILGSKGKVAFFGKPAESADFFRKISNRVDHQSVYGENYNPSVIMDILEENDYAYNKSISSKKQDDTNIEKKNPKRKNIKYRIHEVFISFIKREFKIFRKNSVLSSLLFIIPALLAIIVSLISRYSITPDYTYYYNPNIPVWIIMILVSAFFTGLISTAHELIVTRKLRQSENLIFNSDKTFLSAKLAKTLLISILQSFIICAFSLIIIGQSSNYIGMFLIIWALCWLGSICSLVLSSFFNSLSTVYLLIPVIIIPQLLFSGALIDFSHFNRYIKNSKYVPLTAEVVPLKWATEAVLTDLYKNNNYNKDVFDINVIVYEAAYYTDYFLPRLRDLSQKDESYAEKIFHTELLKNIDLPDNIELSNEYYSNIKRAAIQKRDSILERKCNYDKLKYTNRATSLIAHDNLNIENYVLTENEIIRKFMPIYKLPDNNTIRTHFLSPYKRLGSLYIDSVYFNFFVIVFFSVVLVVFLYFKKL